MSITNQAKPSTALANSTQPNRGVTWDTWTTAWQDETRTWDGLGVLITNTTKDTGGGIWASTDYPWLDELPWLTMDTMVNQSKP